MDQFWMQQGYEDELRTDVQRLIRKYFGEEAESLMVNDALIIATAVNPIEADVAQQLVSLGTPNRHRPWISIGLAESFLVLTKDHMIDLARIERDELYEEEDEDDD